MESRLLVGAEQSCAEYGRDQGYVARLRKLERGEHESHKAHARRAND